MRYVDARRRVEKAARIDAGVMTQRLPCPAKPWPPNWLKGMMMEGASMDAVRPWILGPGVAPAR